jgi:GNAT superfamily N-acetyltransferase
MDAFTIRPATNADAQVIRELIWSVLLEFGLSPDPGGTDADLTDLEASYQRTGGSFDVLTDSGGRIIGTVGIRALGGGNCELRKMYLHSHFRGRGLGKRLLQHAVDLSRRLGFTRIDLETATVLEAARGLYESFGFQPREMHHVTCRCDRAYSLDLAESG